MLNINLKLNHRLTNFIIKDNIIVTKSNNTCYKDTEETIKLYKFYYSYIACI